MKANRRVGARELKTRLGRYLRAVRSGETLVVTERGEAVAELKPLGAPKGDMEARMTLLAGQGTLRRGSGGFLPRFRAVVRSGRSMSQTVLEDREERF